MKMKFGALVVDGRGKIGGHVASKNRAGAYLRTKVTPVNPQTTFQLQVRSRFTGLSQGWRSLTQEQRDAWNAAVGDFQTTDIFGDLRNPTGFNLHQRLNNNLLNIGEAVILIPPLPSEVEAIVCGEVAAGSALSTLTVAFVPSILVGTKVKMFATAPTSAGKSFVKSEYRQVAVLDSTDTTPYDLAAGYIAKFGSVGQPNQKIFVKIVPINVVTGQSGTGCSNSGIVGA